MTATTGRAAVRSAEGFAIQPPIHRDGSAMFHAGSEVPVKFTVAAFDGGTGAEAHLTYAEIVDDVVGHFAAADALGEAGNQFHADAVPGHFVFHWDTTGLGPGFYRLHIELGSGEIHEVDLELV